MIKQQLGTDSLMFALEKVTTTGGATLDTVGADYATIRVAIASELTTDAVGATISILQNDTTVVSNFSTTGMTADRTAEAFVSGKILTYHVDLRGRKRYLRLTIDPVGTAASDDAVTATVCATLTRQVEGPGATTDMADAAVII
jgi:hypothetical protein